MTEHVLEWLNAYLDGELGGRRLRQVEAHLDGCAGCRAELASLSALSTLLRKTPPPVQFTPPERFATRLALRLPRNPQPAPRNRAVGLAGWLVPAGLLLAWIFVQSVFLVSTLVTAADGAGLLPAETALLEGTPQHSLLFGAPLELFGSQLGEGSRATLNLLDEVSLVGSSLVTGLLWQAGIGLLYIGWLVLWFVRDQGQPWLPTAA